MEIRRSRSYLDGLAAKTGESCGMMRLMFWSLVCGASLALLTIGVGCGGLGDRSAERSGKLDAVATDSQSEAESQADADRTASAAGVAPQPAEGSDEMPARGSAAADTAAAKLAEARNARTPDAAIRAALEGYEAAASQPECDECVMLATELLAEMKRQDAERPGGGSSIDADIPLMIR